MEITPTTPRTERSPLGSGTCSVSFLSVCSGIEAASVAWEPLGWKACGFAEIEKFPSAVLAHHWPETPNLGDMTKHNDWPNTLRPNLIVGGTPCQAFSVAGLRKGLADPRGNLTLVFLGILAQFRPRWVVWENVPGVRSADDGQALGSFLGGLEELGYGWAYRTLDAQYANLAQRRERVFVVGHLGDWRRAGAVLFERESLRGNPPPRREAGQGITGTLSARTEGGGGLGTDFECGGGLIAHTLRAEGFDASEDGTGRGTPLIATASVNAGHFGSMREAPVSDPLRAKGGDTGNGGETLVCVHGTQDPCVDNHLAFALGRNSGQENAIAFAQNQLGEIRTGDVAGTLNQNFNASGRNTPMIRQGTAVRRLTPRECERLQGFPDDHTLIPWRGKMASDGPRYKALGNSMAVPVMRWIGERISRLNSSIKES